jgi:dephospho-CoA kinase
MYYPEIPDIRWSGAVYLIGLTGSIGAGKSEASLYFKELGALVYSADEIAREILHRESTKRALLNHFGKMILDQNGDLSNRAIADIVFADSAKLAILNTLIHPEVEKRYAEVRSGIPDGSLAVFDIPLLFETGKGGAFDLTIMISAPIELRLERVKRRNGWSEEEFLRREAAQMHPEEKEKIADLVIRNTGERLELKRAIADIYSNVIGRYRTKSGT